VATGGTAVDAASTTVTLLSRNAGMSDAGGGASAVGAKIHLHPTLDVALMKLASPLVSPTGVQYVNSFYSGSSASLVGRTVYCQGWGDNTLNNSFLSDGSGFGTLRSATLSISKAEGDGYDVVPNASGQISHSGDSGSACFLSGAITGVDVIGDGQTFAHHIGADSIRDWVSGIISQQHVFYRGTDNSIRHMVWDASTSNFYADEWTTQTIPRSPPAAGDPATLLSNGGGQQHVFYRGTDNSIRHIFWNAPNFTLYGDDWTAQSIPRSPPAAGDPATLLSNGGNQQHVFLPQQHRQQHSAHLLGCAHIQVVRG
jgi:hypothetical protein